MTAKDLVMVIDKKHFTVKLHRTSLEVDLKEGARKELEDALEAKSALRGSLGFLFQNIIPLDVSLKNIESVTRDDKGRVKIKIPHRKDIAIQLEREEARKLVEKLNELVPIEKQKVTERLLASRRGKKELARGSTESGKAEAYLLGKDRD
jgi:hypothetical protein